jgi:hypothetical protein
LAGILLLMNLPEFTAEASIYDDKKIVQMACNKSCRCDAWYIAEHSVMIQNVANVIVYVPAMDCPRIAI